MKRHVLIAGNDVGAGSFLIRLLTEIGLDAGFSAETTGSGAERDTEAAESPYVLACRRPGEVLPLLGSAVIDHAFIAVRRFDLAGRDDTASPAPDASQPKLELFEDFAALFEALSRADVSISLLWYPRLAQDPAYLYGKFATLCKEVDYPKFLEAHGRIAGEHSVQPWEAVNAASVADDAAAKATPSEPVAKSLLSFVDAMQAVHAVLNPRSYVEIGCQFGVSLSLARCVATAIDPDFSITRQLAAPTRLFRMTSDDFFQNFSLTRVNGGHFDLALIDGLHHAEAVVRDFMNLEKCANRQSVIVVDDVLPARIEWTSRLRKTRSWTGDVYKFVIILRKIRPDLSIEVFDVDIKGLAVISRLSRRNRALSKNYGEIESDVRNGKYDLPSVQTVRQELRPRPAAELIPHLGRLSIARAKVAAPNAA